MRAVAFLRAINTGNRRVTSEQLKQPFVDLGLGDVQTFQASGNVIFDAPAIDGLTTLTASIEAALAEALGYEVPTYLRTGEDLRSLLAATPFTPEQLAATSGNVQVMFLTAKPTASQAGALAALSTPDDELVLIGREVHWLPRLGVGTSPLKQNLVVKAVGPTTIRGRNAVVRLTDRFFR